jgi:hypothetical protein
MNDDHVYAPTHDDVCVGHAVVIGEDHVVPTRFALYPVITPISVTAVTMRNGIEERRDEVAAFDDTGQPWIVLDGRLQPITWCAECHARGAEVRFEVEEPA